MERKPFRLLASLPSMLRGQREAFTRFVMFMPGRTGSSYVIEKLDSHPNVVARGEIFPKLESGQDMVHVRKKIAKLYRNDYPEEIEVVGFKTKLTNHLAEPLFSDFDELRDILRQAGVDRVMVLVRRNLVKQAVSRLRTEILKTISETSGEKKWNVRANDDKIPRCIIPLDEFDLVLNNYAESNRMLVDYAETLHGSKLLLTYEDMLSDEDGFMTSIFEFLGVPRQRTYSDLIKHTSRNLAEVVGNFQELAERYRGTQFEEMFFETAA
jgi:Sulfotransferase domain